MTDLPDRRRARIVAFGRRPLGTTLLFFLWFGLATLVHGQGVVAAENRQAVSFAPCTIGDGRARVNAECATIETPKDHDLPNGETLPLAIARIRASRASGDRDAFTLIAGGPGQSALESWPGVAFAFRHIARDRDVILIDQRGTGQSNRLDCSAVAPLSTDEQDIAADRSEDAVAQATRDCLAELDSDPTLFTTSVAVRDLEFVRNLLDVSQWNIYGVSYGTRVAQHYARRFPEAVRTMILDAVIPPDVPLGPDVAAFADRALALLFERCQSDADCGTAFPDIAKRTRLWFEVLADNPVDVRYEDLSAGGSRTESFSSEALAGLIRLMSYSALTASLLPSMLDAAMEEDHLAPLVRQSRLQAEALGDNLATGMHSAIVCTEDAPRIGSDATRLARGTYLGDGVVEALVLGCAEWPAGRIDDDFFEPLALDIPTLVLSGEADPITPPSYGERVTRGLSNARHLVNAGQAHMQAPLGCMPVVMAEFIVTADTTSLSSSCLERLTPPPFFIDANGPRP